MKVLKFGGSSVASADRIKNVINIVQQALPSEIAVVFSAFGGVTDQLITIGQLARQSDDQYQTLLRQLEERHLTAVRELLSLQKQSAVLAQTKMRFNELEDILRGVYLVKECSLRTLDYIMSFGERLSAYIVSEAFNDAGIPAVFCDARTLIRTDATFGYALVDFATTNQQIQAHFAVEKKLNIITGFIGSTSTGETTTLGRSGSDYTASIFAAALHASELQIWTDVDGMMTADPRLVKRAFTVPDMSYEEAMELSHFGAKVIFPATMRPVLTLKIPIWVKNTFNPTGRGTCISHESVNGKVIKGISSMNNISLLNIQGSGMVGVVGVSMRLFATLAREKVNVILISQASSEHSICIAIDTASAAKAKQEIEKEFVYEINSNLIDEVQVTKNLSVIAVVGDGMKHRSGSSGRMFSALGRNGVNIVAIAQGSSERNISAVIEQSNVAKALNALHEAFFLSDRKVAHIFLVGTGLIGKTLLQQLREQKEKLLSENHLELVVAGAANSRFMQFNEAGIDLSTAVELLDKQEPMELRTFCQRMMDLNLPNSIFVDCTSSEDVAAQYPAILASNISIVTPNKKANSADYNSYKHMKKTARSKGVRFLYETNVGAGLPVISTLNDLILSGDKLLKIEAVLSGTLNYIFSSFTENMLFSEVVADAKAKGYTEPDPRDDLSGMDVARKILILAREAGWELELTDVSVENLVPEDCRGERSIDTFFQLLKKHDGVWSEKVKTAKSKDEKLRYSAILENGKARVQLTTVDESHPFYQLKGSDNIILLTTERYHDRPMVIRGPGAGAAVTAAGVFADVIRIAHY